MNLLPERYDFANFVEACRNPKEFKKELEWIARHTHSAITKPIFCRKHGYPTNVMREDWDNLIILDACRYDLFSEYNDIDGELDSIVSVASTSEEFMQNTFNEDEFHDTVYVSANGFSHRIENGTFHKFVSTYPQSQRDVLNNDLYQNYTPKQVNEKAIETYMQHQDKRLVVHFMQPHGPYFGSKAAQLRERLKSEHDIEFSAWIQNTNISSRSDGFVYLLDAAEKGYLTSQEIREVYVENLELVLESVKGLLEVVDGKTIITADHGELIGETTNFYSIATGKRYEHPGYVWLPELRIVPWLVIESDGRRHIVPEEPVSTDNVDDNTVDEHLKALGYKV